MNNSRMNLEYGRLNKMLYEVKHELVCNGEGNLLQELQ